MVVLFSPPVLAEQLAGNPESCSHRLRPLVAMQGRKVRKWQDGSLDPMLRVRIDVYCSNAQWFFEVGDVQYIYVYFLVGVILCFSQTRYPYNIYFLHRVRVKLEQTFTYHWLLRWDTISILDPWTAPTWPTQERYNENQELGGGNSNIFGVFTPNLGEMIQFDQHMFLMGWFNHQLGSCCWCHHVPLTDAGMMVQEPKVFIPDDLILLMEEIRLTSWGW